MKFLIIILILSVSQKGFSRIKRIDEKEIDLAKPFRVYMTSGRSTILEFPCEINHTVLGLEEDINLKTGPDNKKTITLWLTSPSVQPTNLTVKCDEEYYVFDIIPNNNNHQDFINIVDTFDSRTEKSLKLIASSDKVAKSENKIRSEESEFEINEKDLMYEVESSQKRFNHSNKDDQILEALNKNSKPRKFIKTITSDELMAEISQSKSKIKSKKEREAL